MYLGIIILFFIMGTVFGSFYNVVGYRVPKGESIVYPPSHCPKCNHKLGPLELIPILSYIFLGGKCKNCKNKISCFYPIFEFASGVLFALSYIKFGFSLDCLLAICFISMLLIIIISDYQTMIIPDSVLLIFGLMIIVIKYFIVGYPSILYSLLDGVIAFIIMLCVKLLGDFIFKRESMGGGDIKLMGIFGIMFGYLVSMFSLFIASVIGLPISILLLKKSKTHEIPFGPFLAIAAIIILLTGFNLDTLMKIYGIK